MEITENNDCGEKFCNPRLKNEICDHMLVAGVKYSLVLLIRRKENEEV